MPFTIPSRLVTNIATLGPLGRFPRAPGTLGSAVGTLTAPFILLPLPIWARVVVCALLFILGGMAATRVERAMGVTDPRMVVVDELLGQWLTYLPFAVLTPEQLAAGFGLFRLFDIIKPWPIRKAETSLPEGFGIMLDDCLAAVYAALGLALLMAV